jgi:bifunctional pyridoxal-dependent enzyme with beta-cystathionase and maltose regulon repressor activities
MFYPEQSPEGHGFMRMNVGAPRSILKHALEQLKEAF